ncbi:MAG: LON peptidase substrate-binding domain-containing protein [Thermoanaerobaculia bacterium]|nr:LON peptidase substrate-binding domain-containing protein [Thermoanaerobaculia bacterium]
MTEPTDSIERPDAPPRILPIFPLTGVLLLPGGRLPLYIFEPRYCNLLDDVLAGDRCMGLVQPVAADPADNQGASETESPEIYPVGCVGLVAHHEELPNERFVVLLEGWCRFRVEEEVETVRGYRRVRACYDDFQSRDESMATQAPESVSPEPLLDALRRFGDRQSLEIEMDPLREVSGVDLLNGLAMALPFQPAEKQALLEAPDLPARQEMLLLLLEMGMEPSGDAPSTN